MRYFIHFGSGLIYSLVLTFCGLIATGMGHGTGTGVFWMLALLPFPLLYWSIVGLLLCRVKSKSIRITVVCLVVVHYLSFAGYLFTLTSQNYEDFLTVWHRNPLDGAFNILFYLAGQFLIWRLLFSGKTQKLSQPLA